ncbi:Alpha-(1,6)-fucosyltransferase, partial [Desmophyllum pertusum]
MGWQLLSVVEDSNRNVAAVIQKERHVELLQSQNGGLKKKLAELQAHKNQLEIEVGQLRKKNLDLERKFMLQKSVIFAPSIKTPPAGKSKRDSHSTKMAITDSHVFTPPRFEFLTTRRRAEKELKEIWYFVSAEVSKINKIVDSDVKSKLRQMLRTVEDMHHALSLNFEKLKTMDGQKEWMEKAHLDLTDLVQRRLHHLQHPKDCDSAKKVVCQINKDCGYGCQVHHLMYCFIVAYGLERTLVIDSSGWRYSSKGWKGIFQPVSETCTTYKGQLAGWSEDASKNEQNILMPIVGSLYPRPPYMPMAVPNDLAARIQRIHSHPFAWWIGQFAKYLFRYAPVVQHEIDKKKALLGFKKPIVG